jgi:hypothetical protein
MTQPEVQPVAWQTPAVPQSVPAASWVQAVVLVPGWQLWQLSAGLSAPEATVPPSTPPMSQLAPHRPFEHTWPFPQDVGGMLAGTFVQLVVLMDGWQVWHGLFGFAGAVQVPLPASAPEQTPELHCEPIVQALPNV